VENNATHSNDADDNPTESIPEVTDHASSSSLTPEPDRGPFAEEIKGVVSRTMRMLNTLKSVQPNKKS